MYLKPVNDSKKDIQADIINKMQTMKNITKAL